MTEEEGDFPTTDDNVESTTNQLTRTAFSLSGAVERLADLIGQFRNNLNLRSASMHRVAITVGGAMFWVIVGLTLIVGVILGLDLSERSSQARQWSENTESLQRHWQVNTDTLQREWQRDSQRAHLDNTRRLNANREWSSNKSWIWALSYSERVIVSREISRTVRLAISITTERRNEDGRSCMSYSGAVTTDFQFSADRYGNAQTLRCADEVYSLQH
jgi:hypothetical protein